MKTTDKSENVETRELPKDASFRDVCKFLNIEDYCDRIFTNNSRGELFHLQDYYWFASLKMFANNPQLFRDIFEICIEASKDHPQRDNIFQHMPAMFNEWYNYCMRMKGKP